MSPVFANAQTTAPATPSQPTPLPPHSEDHGGITPHKRQGKPLPDDVIYMFFIARLTADHWHVQQEIRDAKPGSEPIVEGRNYWMDMGISPDQYQFMLNTVITTASRLAENDRQSSIVVKAWRQRYFRDTKEPVDPEMTRLAKEHDDIIYQMIKTLKQGLGDADFEKFDSWVRSKTALLALRRGAPQEPAFFALYI